MAKKALSFSLPSSDLTNNHFSSKTPHAVAKVFVFTIRWSSLGSGERPWKNSVARLMLEDGSIWRAKSFGASGT
ncbi:hypothetical protein AAZX31_06G205500 [Glycine max]|uniref:Uncharacterized protein n=1 Tax=Glycine soja TaxID=3848 RepID=A0A0B2STC0_GLYSO|nr:hypothetical protein JHK87_015966 [Glycine soja]KAG5046646.1 hypothetical protein JHK86_016052 [Glycine max]KAG5149143.1 hypothetical protein JHK82_016024 [Glycine max]KAH1127046.1 hypothetical protein GYH30_015867 [Glycine max]KHN47502.1 hypothetical protein glysoja_043527 [Glycine soja]